MVTNELRGERVDVVPFSDDPVELIQNALAPARVREVRLDEETGTATVIVSDFQLSLAIGKEGQNARLAARLTGWRIDIKSETQLAEEEAGGYGEQDWAEGEWVEDESGELVWKPAEGGEAMSAEEWTHQAEDPTEAPAAESGAADGATEATAEAADPAAAARRPRSRSADVGAAIRRGRSGGKHRGARRGNRGDRRGRGIAPTRTCVGCRNALPADQLIRIVRLPGGALSVDRHGAGRGAWLCRDSPGCLDEAVRRHGFQRAFCGVRRRRGPAAVAYAPG